MSSNISSSLVSHKQEAPPGVGLRRGWPTLIVLPALIALLGAAALTPMIHLLLGESFGLSGGRAAPWPWLLALVGLIGFWCAKLVGRRGFSPEVSSSLLIVLGLMTIGAWWAAEPHYDLGPVLRNPISLVQENGYLVVPLLLGIGVWYQGIRYDYDPGLFSPEEVRGNVRRSWALLAISIVIAAMTGGEAGNAAVRSAAIAVPVAMACSAGAVAAAEVDSTRRLAVLRGSMAPGWDRWMRLFGGIVVISLVITGIAAVLLGPEALGFVLDTLRVTFRGVGIVIYWIVFGVAYVLYWIFWAVAWVLNSIFGDLFAPIERPTPQSFGSPQSPMEELQEPGEFPFATLLRWIALGLVLISAALIIYRLSRAARKPEMDGEPVEERQSIFSASLARQQLRDLFRRKPKAERPRVLDLDQPPGSVRESMLYLQVLAARQQAGRHPEETPADFTRRLALLWPDVAFQLGVLGKRYEQVRYGETPDDRAAVAEAWQSIWQSRKGVVIPSEPNEAQGP